MVGVSSYEQLRAARIAKNRDKLQGLCGVVAENRTNNPINATYRLSETTFLRRRSKTRQQQQHAHADEKKQQKKLGDADAVVVGVGGDAPLSEICANAQAGSISEQMFSTPPRKKRRKSSGVLAPKTPEQLTPSRLSKRLRGEKPEHVSEADARAASRRLEKSSSSSSDDDSGTKLYTRKGRPRLQLVLPKHEIKAPFTLRSIGVTVLSLGEIYRGQWKNKYWSSTGCLFHHAYPVGYKATKWHFNRHYTMWIEAGEYGPIFAVREDSSNIVFRGESPTKPWTKVCLHKRTGARISGPLHFGFSDPTTQSAIASMYTESELQAALEGSKAWNDVLSSQEKAAKEFMEVEGIGETAAMVLATTTSLGGKHHKTKKSLAKWAALDEGEKLKDFLLNSSELPESLLRWPGWRHKFVPRIISALVTPP